MPTAAKALQPFVYFLLLGSLGGCHRDASGVMSTTYAVTTTVEALELSDPDGRVVARVVHSPAQVPDAPEAGEYQIHLIDVGTGLAVLVRGADFTFLFDGGSSDDFSGGRNNRLVAYLTAALGPSSIDNCLPRGDWFPSNLQPDVPRIDAIMLSHPHLDHGSLLPDVLRCFEVGEVYDVGVINQTDFYQSLLEAVSEEPDVRYWTVVPPPSPPEVTVNDAIDFTGVDWDTFAEGNEFQLGDGAILSVLYADDQSHPDAYNENSLVVRLDLGNHSALLTGDAEAGGRASPDEQPPPTASKANPSEEHTEGYLMRHYADEIDVDILQVGHHGSMTSSRRDFVDAVSPTWTLIGAGPRKYRGHRLPDATVHRMFEDLAKQTGGYSLSTDFDDRRCPVNDRIGRNNSLDKGWGGCSNYVLFLPR